MVTSGAAAASFDDSETIALATPEHSDSLREIQKFLPCPDMSTSEPSSFSSFGSVTESIRYDTVIEPFQQPVVPPMPRSSSLKFQKSHDSSDLGFAEAVMTSSTPLPPSTDTVDEALVAAQYHRPLTEMEREILKQECSRLDELARQLETQLEVEQRIQTGAHSLMRAYSKDKDSRNYNMANVQLMHSIRKENSVLRELNKIRSRLEQCRSKDLGHATVTLANELLKSNQEITVLKDSEHCLKRKWKEYRSFLARRDPNSALQDLADAKIEIMELRDTRERLRSKCVALSEALDYQKQAYNEVKNSFDLSNHSPARSHSGQSISLCLESENLALKRELDAVKSNFDLLMKQNDLCSVKSSIGKSKDVASDDNENGEVVDRVLCSVGVQTDTELVHRTPSISSFKVKTLETKLIEERKLFESEKEKIETNERHLNGLISSLEFELQEMETQYREMQHQVLSYQRNWVAVEKAVLQPEERDLMNPNFACVLERIAELCEKKDAVPEDSQLIEALRSDIHDKEETIAKLNATVEELRLAIITESDKLISTFQSDFETIAAETEQREAKIGQLEKELEESRGLVAHRENELHETVRYALGKWLAAAEQLYFENKPVEVLSILESQTDLKEVLETYFASLFKAVDRKLASRASDILSMKRELELLKETRSSSDNSTQRLYEERIKEIQKTLETTVLELESSHRSDAEARQLNYNQRLQEERDNHDQQIKKRDNEFAKELERLERKISELERSCQDKDETIRELEYRLENERPATPTTRQVLQKDVETIQERWARLQKVHEQNLIELESSLTTIEQLKQTLSSKDTEREKLLQEREDLLNEFEKLTSKWTDFDSERQKLRQMVQVERERADKLESRLKTAGLV